MCMVFPKTCPGGACFSFMRFPPFSAADILVSAINMPVAVYTIQAGDWDFSDSSCVFLGLVTMLTFVTSVMSLGAISINRYIMVCHPAKLKIWYTSQRTGFWIAGTVLILVAFFKINFEVVYFVFIQVCGFFRSVWPSLHSWGGRSMVTCLVSRFVSVAGQRAQATPSSWFSSVSEVLAAR